MVIHQKFSSAFGGGEDVFFSFDSLILCVGGSNF
jgi:hypothetical protein